MYNSPIEISAIGNRIKLLMVVTFKFITTIVGRSSYHYKPTVQPSARLTQKNHIFMIVIRLGLTMTGSSTHCYKLNVYKMQCY